MGRWDGKVEWEHGMESWNGKAKWEDGMETWNRKVGGSDGGDGDSARAADSGMEKGTSLVRLTLQQDR